MDWLQRILSLWINLSPSLPLGVYHTVHTPPLRGAIIVACLPITIGTYARARGYLGYGPCPGRVERLGKRVAAVAGDTIDTDAEGVRINGFWIPGSRPLVRDASGRLLPRAPKRQVVGAGELFLLATDNRRSFDGRYFGAVAVSDLVVVERILGVVDRVRPLERSPKPSDGEPQLEAGHGQADYDAGRHGDRGAAGGQRDPEP